MVQSQGHCPSTIRARGEIYNISSLLPSCWRPLPTASLQTRGNFCVSVVGVPFLPRHFKLEATFVFAGQFCNNAAEKRAAKDSFKSWDTPLLTSSCYGDSSCDLTDIHCKSSALSFEITVCFKELSNEVLIWTHCHNFVLRILVNT